MKMGKKSTNVLGVRIDSIDERGVLNWINLRLTAKSKFFLATINPEILTKAFSKPQYRKLLNKTDLNIADGAGLVLISDLLRLGKLHRVTGRYILQEVLRGSLEKKELKIYLLGADEEVINKCVLKATKSNPNLKIKGGVGPWFDEQLNFVSKRDTNLQRDIIDKINGFSPDILFVGFGAPKQEMWIDRHIAKLKIGGAIGIGGSFNYFAGIKPLPPGWISTLGFEWVWRSFNERGHIKRVWQATVVFMYDIILFYAFKRKSLSSSRH